MRENRTFHKMKQWTFLEFENKIHYFWYIGIFFLNVAHSLSEPKNEISNLKSNKCRIVFLMIVLCYAYEEEFAFNKNRFFPVFHVGRIYHRSFFVADVLCKILVIC